MSPGFRSMIYSQDGGASCYPLSLLSSHDKHIKYTTYPFHEFTASIAVFREKHPAKLCLCRPSGHQDQQSSTAKGPKTQPSASMIEVLPCSRPFPSFPSLRILALHSHSKVRPQSNPHHNQKHSAIVHVSFQPADSPSSATLTMLGSMASVSRPSAGLDEPLVVYLHGYICSRLRQATVKAVSAASSSSTSSSADELEEEFQGLPIAVSAALLDRLVPSLTPNSNPTTTAPPSSSAKPAQFPTQKKTLRHGVHQKLRGSACWNSARLSTHQSRNDVDFNPAHQG